MVTKEQISSLSGIVASASIAAVGFAIGGIIGSEVMGSIGISLSAKIIERGGTKLKERWLSSDYGILNCDIQRALARALVKALEHLEDEYFELTEAGILPAEEKECIKALFKEMRKQVGNALPTLLKTIKENEIKEYLDVGEKKNADRLLERINTSTLLDTYGKHFKDFFCQNLQKEVQLCFAEELKTDNKECNKAWRTFQLLLLEGIEQDLKVVQASQDLIRQDLEKLAGVRDHLQRLGDVIERRVPDEPFQKGLETAIGEMHSLLQDVAKTTQRTKKTVDEIAVDVKTIAEKASKKAELGVWVGHECDSRTRLAPDPKLGEIDFGCSVNEKDRVFCAIRVYVYNSGDLSAEDVSMRLTFPRELRDDTGPMKVKYVGMMGIENASKRLAYTDEHNEYVEYSIPRLDPRLYWLIAEPVSMAYPPSLSAGAFQAVTKDGVPINFRLNVEIVGPFFSSIQVAVWARNISPVKGYFFIRRFEAKNMMELKNKIEEDREKAIEEMLKDPKNSERMRVELLKNVIAIVPELTIIGKTQSGGWIYQELHPERSEMAVLETSESILEAVRLSDGSIQMPRVPKSSIVFRMASDGSLKKLKKGKKGETRD
jgi:hypothetical protein